MFCIAPKKLISIVYESVTSIKCNLILCFRVYHKVSAKRSVLYSKNVRVPNSSEVTNKRKLHLEEFLWIKYNVHFLWLQKCFSKTIFILFLLLQTTSLSLLTIIRNFANRPLDARTLDVKWNKVDVDLFKDFWNVFPGLVLKALDIPFISWAYIEFMQN